MSSKGFLLYFNVLYLVLIFVGFQGPVQGRLFSEKKPAPKDVAARARRLVSHNIWGVLSTVEKDLGGAPIGNVVSFNDGLPHKGSGIPYLYLTALNPTAQTAMKDERASFTISEYPLGTCGKKDPQNSICAKITLN